MNLQLTEELTAQIERIEENLDRLEDAGGSDFVPEKSQEWMASYKEKIQLDGKLYLVVNKGSEIQFNEGETAFRVVNEENRGKKFW